MNPTIHNLSAVLLIYTRPAELLLQLRQYAKQEGFRFVVGLIQVTPHSRWTTYSIQEPVLYQSRTFTSPEAAIEHGETVLRAICLSGHKALTKPDDPIGFMLGGVDVITLETVKLAVTALRSNDPGKLVNMTGLVQETGNAT